MDEPTILAPKELRTIMPLLPGWRLAGNRVSRTFERSFELTRYDVGGRVTDQDVEIAKKISSVYGART